MKVIFLDIDGVLNVYCQSRDEYGCNFHQHFIDNLATLINVTQAKIVISSTWRLSGLSVMQEMWKHRNLPGEVIDITPNLTYGVNLNTSTPRGKEIQQWLDNNPTTHYVILDDDTDMLEHQLPHFVRTSDNKHHTDYVDVGYGLTIECTQEAIKILS